MTTSSDLPPKHTAQSNKNSNNGDDDDGIEDFIQNLPKVELHVHLDGSFESDIIYRHLTEMWPDFSCLPVHTTLPWDLSSKFPVRKLVKDCKDLIGFTSLCSCRGKQSFQEMIKCFEIFNPIVRGNLQLIEELSYDFCRRQAEQRVIYTEVRYSPHLLAAGSSLSGEEVVDAVPVIDAVTKGLMRGSKEFGIIVNQILCCISFRPDWALDIIELANERRNSYPCAVVGVDIAAGEEHFDSRNHQKTHVKHLDAIKKAQDLNLNITLHAGEVGGGENVASALHNYGAQRIGHAYHIVSDDVLLSELREKKIHIETCPISSIETGSWKFREGEENWIEHPCVIMMKKGLSIGFNSDDPAVFNTSLSSQYRIVMNKMKKGEEIILNSIKDAIDSAFCSSEIKDDLGRQVRAFEEERSSRQRRRRTWNVPFCDRIRDL